MRVSTGKAGIEVIDGMTWDEFIELSKDIKDICICFPGGRYKALTMNYDDGREEDCRLVDIFNGNEIKGMLHLNSGFRYGENGLCDFLACSPTTMLYTVRGGNIMCHKTSKKKLKMKREAARK